MFPFIFEWNWDMSHLVFMGALWYALAVIGLGITFCLIKTIIDRSKGENSTHHH
jgi:hypothetical protein